MGERGKETDQARMQIHTFKNDESDPALQK